MIIVDEGNRVGNFGSEVASIIAEEAVEYIQAPILKVTAPMCLFLILPYWKRKSTFRMRMGSKRQCIRSWNTHRSE